MADRISSFLGANTPNGFVSFFDELYNPYRTTNAYIIKGGPGTGKSTFMKKTAAALNLHGISTEWVYCSSDPDSLDGLIAPEIGFSLADGTSPHVLEPKFPGCGENIINPGAFWDEKKLKKQADTIRSLTLENSLHHRRSSGYLSAAGSIDNEIQLMHQRYIKEDKINSFANRFIMRELPKKKGCQPGRRSKRFLSGITPKGVIFFGETVTKLASRIIGICDDYSAVSPLIVSRIAEGAIKHGYDVILCHCPMRPRECEHIIIPEVGLALITVKNEHETGLLCDRFVHAKRFLHEGIKDKKSVLRFDRRLKNELINEAVQKLKEAKHTHDRLERIYIDALDYEKLNSYCDEFIKRLLEGIG